MRISIQSLAHFKRTLYYDIGWPFWYLEMLAFKWSKCIRQVKILCPTSKTHNLIHIPLTLASVGRHCNHHQVIPGVPGFSGSIRPSERALNKPSYRSKFSWAKKVDVLFSKIENASHNTNSYRSIPAIMPIIYLSWCIVMWFELDPSWAFSCNLPLGQQIFQDFKMTCSRSTVKNCLFITVFNWNWCTS